MTNEEINEIINSFADQSTTGEQTANATENNTPENSPLTTEDVESLLESSGETSENLRGVPQETTQETQEESTELIPENSNSSDIAENTSRFSSAAWFNDMKETIITIAGLGGIGSYVAFMVSRLHPKRIILYDDDTVENANLSGQMFRRCQVNQYKTDAITDNMVNFSGYYLFSAHNDKFTSHSGDKSPIMICGFDNMEARKTYFNSWLNSRAITYSNNPELIKNMLFIDGRLAAEEFQILCIRGDDTYNIKRYQKEFLFTDEEADPTICSYKQTTYCACMIASFITNLLINHVSNIPNVLIQRDLPFYTSYNAERMFFKTEA